MPCNIHVLLLCSGIGCKFDLNAQTIFIKILNIIFYIIAIEAWGWVIPGACQYEILVTYSPVIDTLLVISLLVASKEVMHFFFTMEIALYSFLSYFVV